MRYEYTKPDTPTHTHTHPYTHRVSMGLILIDTTQRRVRT